MRIVFLGTPVDAVQPLRALVDDGHDVALVVTQPDRRRTRGAGVDPSPVKEAALELGLRVLTPEKARMVVDDVRSSGAELGVVVAFGQLLPVSLLEALPYGFVNLHFSLLPRWRGAAPVERAILAGDSETGVDLMRIDAGLDTGPVFARRRVAIDPAETAGELHLRLVEAGTELLRRHLPTIPNEDPEPQVGEPTYAEKLTVDEFRLDPQRAASDLARIARAGNPRPGAWLRVGGRRVKVWRAHEAPAPARGRARGDRRGRSAGNGERRARARRGPTGGQEDHDGHRLAVRAPGRRARRRPVSGRPPESSRRVALDALLRIEDGAYAHILLPPTLRNSGLEARDRALVTDLVYGTVRMQRALDVLLATVSNRGIGTLDPPVRAALRLGAYQLLIGVPAHAAVGETVEVVDPRARGFVNGVLRALARKGPPFRLSASDDVAAIAVRTSHPDWVVQMLVDGFGTADAIATLELDNAPPPVTLRVNPLLTTIDDLTAELVAAGADVQRGTLVPGALLLRHTGDLAALPAIAEGRATPQDQASQAVVAVLDPQPGERVLDLAAAPGGKATAAAERMGGSGLVVAADLHPGRVRTVLRAAERIGVRDTVATIVADGRSPAVRDGRVRPCTPRCALQWPRCAPPASRRALAGATGRRARPRRAATRPARGRGRRGATVRSSRVLRVHLVETRDRRDRRVGRGAPSGVRRRAPAVSAMAAARPGRRSAAFRRADRRHVRPQPDAARVRVT